VIALIVGGAFGGSLRCSRDYSRAKDVIRRQQASCEVGPRTPREQWGAAAPPSGHAWYGFREFC